MPRYRICSTRVICPSVPPYKGGDRRDNRIHNLSQRKGTEGDRWDNRTILPLMNLSPLLGQFDGKCAVLSVPGGIEKTSVQGQVIFTFKEPLRAALPGPSILPASHGRDRSSSAALIPGKSASLSTFNTSQGGREFITHLISIG